MSNEEWIFYEELDSLNHDINHIPNLSVDSMKMEGEYMNNCVAFNTFGFFKSKIEFPLIRSNYYGYSKREGIYIKKSYLERILLNEDKNQWICNLTDIHTEEFIYNKYISNKISNQKSVCFIHNCKIGCNKENEILDILLNTMSDNNDFLDFIDLIIINNFGDYLEPNFYKNDKILILNYSTFTNQYEIPTLKLINYFSNQNSDIKLLYLHSKGVSYNKDNINYSASMNWNKYMLYFLVKKYKRCIELLDSFDTVGCNYRNNNEHPKHYSGNFWWANTNYIKKLSISQLQSKYDGEFWILSNNDVNISNLFNLKWEDFDKPYLYDEDLNSISKICFITAIYGNYETSCKKFKNQTIKTDFICFTDNANIVSNDWIIDTTPYHLINKSNLDNDTYINSLCNNNHSFNIAKYYKQAFQNIPILQKYDVIIWIDGTIEIIYDKTSEYILNNIYKEKIIGWHHEARYGILEDEVKASHFKRYTSTYWNNQSQPYQDIDNQYKCYLEDGYNDLFFKNIKSHTPHFGVWLTCFIAFLNNDNDIKNFLDLWYLQTLKYTTQDQIGFPYVCQKTEIVPYTLPNNDIYGDFPHHYTMFYIKNNHGL